MCITPKNNLIRVRSFKNYKFGKHRVSLSCPRILMHPNWRLEQAGIKPPSFWLADDLHYFPSYSQLLADLTQNKFNAVTLTTNVKRSLHNNKNTSQHCNSTTTHTAATKIIILLNPDSLTHIQANTRTYSPREDFFLLRTSFNIQKLSPSLQCTSGPCVLRCEGSELFFRAPFSHSAHTSFDHILLELLTTT